MLGTGFSDFAYADRERRDSNSYTTVWSTPSAELDDYNPYPQTMIPDDVPTPSTSQFQSPSSENMAPVIDFDYSCLDGLDEKLLLNPMEAFAELCWMQAVEDYDDRSPTPTPTLSHPSLQRVPRYSDITMGSTVYHADEEDGDFPWHRKSLISGTSTPVSVTDLCILKFLTILTLMTLRISARPSLSVLLFLLSNSTAIGHRLYCSSPTLLQPTLTDLWARHLPIQAGASLDILYLAALFPFVLPFRVD
ncbi:hypothetical protein K435DRAFT_23500 [Dendrothele bispora CBS 962.96]|uniref:Uncharacterized protein n=1 Tax=Dendrothele bispora (strain CBS 962.96) TaxID=1314807 RepID=A0A4S8MTF3_DENBC|nr:hypothetical protein K435DRAFT_23500 [Dendrothele bispora CBS 962.96]